MCGCKIFLCFVTLFDLLCANKEKGVYLVRSSKNESHNSIIYDKNLIFIKNLIRLEMIISIAKQKIISVSQIY